jgi:hypothetical protein
VTAGRAVGRSARGIALIAALAGVGSGCAGLMGKRAAEGAVKAIEEQDADKDPRHQIARVAAERAVEGAVSALEEPAQRAVIQRLVNEAVSAAATLAVEKATRQMVAELGPDGDGPLAVSLSRTGERVSAAAVGGVGSEIAQLAPECVGLDPLGCLERRLQRTARSTAASFTAGVKDTAGWQLLLVAFVLGACGGLLAAWLWSLRHLRRRTLRMVES